MERIIKAYWTCKYCDTANIDGLIDICPNCGKQKSEDVRYYMNNNIIEVSEQELQDAGISKEECDGNHKDWICNHCNQLNNWADLTCAACGSSKNEATLEYGMKRDIEPASTIGVYDGFSSSYNSSIGDSYFQRPISKKDLYIVICSSLIAIFLLLFAFWPIHKTITITDFSWKRNITVEEERTVKESDWFVPSEGRVYDEKLEFKQYVSVIDHYETVTETKSRQVISHYETTYSYRDNGNGTFSEIPSQHPVYKTEYYTETSQQPVYRQDPVYATKYYYEIERWFDVKEYPSANISHEPYWNEDYVLKDNERDTKRYAEYWVYYSDGSRDKVSYDYWKSLEIGDGFIVTHNRLGIVYSQKPMTE